MEKSTLNIHADLIDRCRLNDQVAQYEVYGLYSKAMYNTSLRMMGSQADAEDVLQEAFISAFKNIDSYRGEASFGSWLKRIVINKALGQLKKNEKANNLVVTEELPDRVEIQEEELSFTVDSIKAAVHDLPTGFRSVLILYLFEGYDHGEISEILNISISTSKTQYKRAKEKLKKLLKSEVKYG